MCTGVDISRVILPGTYSLTEPVVLPKGFVAALYETEAYPQVVLSSSTWDTSPPEEVVAFGLGQMISETLDLPQ